MQSHRSINGVAAAGKVHPNEPAVFRARSRLEMNEIPGAHQDSVATGDSDARNETALAPSHSMELSPLDGGVDPGPDDRRGATNDSAGKPNHAQPHNHRDGCRDSECGPATAASELIAIAPRGELGPQRFANPYQLQSFGQSGESDVFCGHSLEGVAEQALAAFDCFPTFLEWREVPPLAFLADNPEAAPPLIERQPPPNRERLDDLV